MPFKRENRQSSQNFRMIVILFNLSSLRIRKIDGDAKY